MNKFGTCTIAGWQQVVKYARGNAKPLPSNAWQNTLQKKVSQKEGERAAAGILYKKPLPGIYYLGSGFVLKY